MRSTRADDSGIIVLVSATRGTVGRASAIALVIAAVACAEGNSVDGLGGGSSGSAVSGTSGTGNTTASVASTGAGTPKDCSGTPAKPLGCGNVCVDPRTDVTHCGGCDHACDDPPNGDAACVDSVCVVGDCIDGYADCNDDPTDGCEEPLVCGPGTPLPDCDAACAGMTCVPVAETCNLQDDDCDTECDEGGIGCRVGVHRSVGETGHFYTTDAVEAGCCNMTVETTNYFYLYAAQAPGLVPFYRCLLPSGYHHYTLDAGCAGGIAEGTMGYVATAATCGASPLYYLAHPGGDHFYTTDAGERDYAVTLGYADQGVIAYMWLAP